MDYDKLIEHLRRRGLGNGSALGPHSGLYEEAALAIETLRAENERLRADKNKAIESLSKIVKLTHEQRDTAVADLARVTEERDAAIEDVLDAAIAPCSYCKKNPVNGGNCDMDNETHEMYSCWKWRGDEEDD